MWPWSRSKARCQPSIDVLSDIRAELLMVHHERVRVARSLAEIGRALGKIESLLKHSEAKGATTDG
jgi:hypothetical protein